MGHGITARLALVSSCASRCRAVKIPKAITHERRPKETGDLLDRFFFEVEGLGSKLGPLLVQLPPSLSFQAGTADAFHKELRGRVAGAIAP